jgi:GTP diphosphokinase / guanosine-3',5'-bis(diphosphate) 3'-diphosphatase
MSALERAIEMAARAQNPVVRVVKLADMADNMNVRRIPRLTQRDLKRLQAYQQVRELLLDQTI